MTFIARPDWYTSASPDPLPATGRPLRWGVVATGNISTTVTKDLALLEDSALQAVSSRSRDSADAFASRFGFQDSYYDDGGTRGYERLVADPNVDVVYIGTPHAQHYDVALAALQAGKHVLCEKALTINAAEARELAVAARSTGVFLMEAVWARFVPGMQRAFQLAASGELGNVKWVRADLGFAAPYDPSSRLWARSDGGGALLDISVYPVLWAWGTLGAPNSVTAAGALTEEDVDSLNAITFGYKSGAVAQFVSYLTAFGPRVATVAGTKGYLESVGSINNPRTLRISLGRDDIREEHFDVAGAGYTYQLREVSRCIQSGLLESPTMPVADSVALLEIFDGIRGQLGITYPNDARTP